MTIDTSVAEDVVPAAVELGDDELDNLFGGAACGCGWICTHTGECGCTNGMSVCWCP